MRYFKNIDLSQGVTYSEILLVFIAFSILLVIVIFVFGNHDKELISMRNSRRSINVWMLVDSVHKYEIDHAGFISTSIPLSETEICNSDAISCDGFVDLSLLVFEKKYISDIPEDPENISTNGSGYVIWRSEENRVTVKSMYAEENMLISITK